MNEDQKSRLEIKVLERKLSWSTELREWLQALTTLVAFGGLAWAIVLNVSQMRYNQNTMRADQIAKQFAELNLTLAQIGGERRSERASGVSQLGFLMNDASMESIVRDRALVATVGAISVEEDPVVRDLLIERIERLRIDLFPRSTIESVAAQLLRRNQQLAQYLTEEELYKFIISRLNIQPCWRCGRSVKYPSYITLELEATGQALALLIGKSADRTAKDAAENMVDLSGLICINCTFRCQCISPLRLRFLGAIFVNTQFVGLREALDLRNSDFSTSSHYKTVFDNVNVQKVSFAGEGDSKMERYILKHFEGDGNYQLSQITLRNTKSYGADFTDRRCQLLAEKDIGASGLEVTNCIFEK